MSDKKNYSLIDEFKKLENESKYLQNKNEKFNKNFFEQMGNLGIENIIPENHEIPESKYNNQVIKDEEDIDEMFKQRGWDGREETNKKKKSIWDLLK